MTAYIMFLRCVSYLIFVGVLMFIAGRFLPKSLFHHHRFPFRVFASEKRGTIYVHLGVRKWLATRCACANRIGTSIACSKASRPLSISTCSVKAVTKHSACWPFATICALILTTAHVTPQKSADSPRKNGRIFRITPSQDSRRAGDPGAHFRSAANFHTINPSAGEPFASVFFYPQSRATPPFLPMLFCVACHSHQLFVY